jgi:hypothetical protein
MAAITASEFSVNAGGDIRVETAPQIHTVLELHEWLQAMADDANSTGNDTVSILTTNPSKLDGPRSAIKPMLLNLLSTFNIDATAAQYFKFGSISQNAGADLYTGVKSIGSPLVAGSPIYIVQNNAKLTSYWPVGHIQILVKAITASLPIDSGDIRVFSRKYGQTYGDFAANLIAGGEQPAAISTAPTDWTSLSQAAALALTGITITTGDTNQNTGDGNGSKLYKGTITLSGGRTIAEAAQYCQAICNEASAITVDGVPGWRFRSLGDGANGYTPNGAAPFGVVAGGKWFVAQGWYIAGALAGDLQKYQMISHDGTGISNPVVAGISIGGLTVGARLLVGRDSGSNFITNEYTLTGATTSGGNTCIVNEAIKADTPDTGYIRVNGVPYSYTALNRGTRTFTISGTWGQIHAAASPAWCPYIDKLVASTTESSSTYTYVADFPARLKVRKGATGGSLQAFETTFTAASSATNGTNAIATSDE